MGAPIVRDQGYQFEISKADRLRAAATSADCLWKDGDRASEAVSFSGEPGVQARVINDV
jgi:hypothetical protein